MRSAICRSDADSIRIHGLDLAADILGKVDLGQMAFLEIWGRLPDEREDAVFNALVVALVEHGLTPSVLAARLTYLGAPDSLQAAVAAGLSGVGTVFVGSIEGAARMLQEAEAGNRPADEIPALARDIVARFKAEKRIIPGLGHPIHKQADPRTERLLAIAAENGFRGNHVRLLEAVAAEAERSLGRHLPVNVSGAIGAIASELGLDWRVCRGIGLIARTIGLVAHLLEEIRSPLARELWLRTEHDAQPPA
ncbi:citryl-CoA lyase [Azospirillum sp. ST 5-10]|uniref:citryl-CoA lyase n=1 Tax=unclassified Azospirillum TaxID=2630922 RepID=UPI003F4A4302